MSKVEYKNFEWKGNKLYHFDQDTKVRLYRDRSHPTMWHFKTAEDTVSDMFSYVRAKDNGIKDTIFVHNAKMVLEAH